MKNRHKKILLVLMVFIAGFFTFNVVHALDKESGVVTINKCSKNPESSPYCKNNVYSDDFSEFEDEAYYSENYVQLDFSTDKMQATILSAIGTPEANVFVLLLFSFAALLQIARVITGQGDWISFIIRVLVILAFLRGFSILFDGVEAFFAYLGDQILEGKSAFDVLWKSQITILKKFSVDFGSFWDMISWDSVKQVFKNSVSVFLLTSSYIFAYGIYICLYIVQNCIIIGLKYLGPLLIALSIIPEINFSEGYIKSLFQVLSWTIIMSILIKILATIPKISMSSMIGPTDFVTISAMNFCFGLCFMIVPKIAEMVFSGSGFASVGMAAAKVAGKAMKFAAVSGLPAMGKASVIGATFGKVGGAVVKANSGVGQDGAAGSSSDSKSKNPLATQKSNHHVDSGSSAGNKKTSQSTQGNTYYDGGQGI